MGSVSEAGSRRSRSTSRSRGRTAHGGAGSSSMRSTASGISSRSSSPLPTNSNTATHTFSAEQQSMAASAAANSVGGETGSKAGSKSSQQRVPSQSNSNNKGSGVPPCDASTTGYSTTGLLSAHSGVSSLDGIFDPDVLLDRLGFVDLDPPLPHEIR